MFAIVFGGFALSRPDEWTTGSTSSRQPSPSVPTSSTRPAADVPPAPAAKKTPDAIVSVTYNAVHRHALGGQCAGTVRLDPTTFHYESAKHHVTITRQAVQRIDGAGFVDAAGKKWHFRFQSRSDADAEHLLRGWLARGRVP
jgi:hypothetical protein